MINRGSEWRRWELHLHTPGTKKSDQYRGQMRKKNGIISILLFRNMLMTVQIP